MVRLAKEQGSSLTGPDGLPKQFTKTVPETAAEREMTGHLGHEKHEPAGDGSGNLRGQHPNRTTRAPALSETMDHLLERGVGRTKPRPPLTPHTPPIGRA